jgi:hypothetical protein
MTQSLIGKVLLRITVSCGAAVVLASCAGVPTGNNVDWEHARLACIDVGIAPGSPYFDQCVSNLYNTLSEELSTTEH